jgi:hypothetical protein
MKICDRHYYMDGSSVPSVETVRIDRTDETFDLCKTCLDAVRDFMTQPEDKSKVRAVEIRKSNGTGRPRKNS